jgi:hypothetical protein
MIIVTSVFAENKEENIEQGEGTIESPIQTEDSVESYTETEGSVPDNIELGSKKVDWQNKTDVALELERNEMRLTLSIEDELIDNIAYAKLLVLQTGFGQKDEYSLIYASEQLQPQGGMLRATYNGEALYLTDEIGEVIDGPLEPHPHEDGIALYSILEDINWNQEGVYLLWRPQEDGSYTMTGIETYNADLDMFTMSSRKPEPGDNFMIGGYVKRLPDTDEAYRDWPWGDTILYCLVPYTEGVQWRLRYLPMNAEYDRIAMFEIMDIQGNMHLSKMIPLK